MLATLALRGRVRLCSSFNATNAQRNLRTTEQTPNGRESKLLLWGFGGAGGFGADGVAMGLVDPNTAPGLAVSPRRLVFVKD